MTAPGTSAYWVLECGSFKNCFTHRQTQNIKKKFHFTLHNLTNIQMLIMKFLLFIFLLTLSNLANNID